jgi:hypothetical protein
MIYIYIHIYTHCIYTKEQYYIYIYKRKFLSRFFRFWALGHTYAHTHTNAHTQRQTQHAHTDKHAHTHTHRIHMKHICTHTHTHAQTLFTDAHTYLVHLFPGSKEYDFSARYSYAPPQTPAGDAAKNPPPPPQATNAQQS